MHDHIEPRKLRDALGCFATGVTVVTMRLPDGSPEGITVNSFASVSLDPALVLFSVNRSSRCAAALEEATGIAIHILGSHHAELSRAFARRGGADWSQIRWEPDAKGTPVLQDCPTTLGCAIHSRLDGGDHVIVLARVLSIATHGAHDPLLFFRGEYCRIAPGAAAPA